MRIVSIVPLTCFIILSFLSDFQKLDGHFEAKKQKQSDSRDPVLKQMQDLSQTFQDTADRLTGIERNLEILMQKQIADAFQK